MATSTIPTLKANLVTRLQARAGLNGVQVSYGPPLPAPSRELIWCGVAKGQQDWQAMAVKGEQYDLELVISVRREGENMQAADERCFTIYAEVENEVRADKTVNGAVRQASITGFELGEFVTDSMREATLTVQLECQAEI
jgi:hypothetical protein